MDIRVFWQKRVVLNYWFDPFISPNPLAAHINIDEIEADFIMVSHGHEDHMADLVILALKTGATVICAWEIMQWLKKHGVSKVHPMTPEVGSISILETYAA